MPETTKYDSLPHSTLVSELKASHEEYEAAGPGGPEELQTRLENLEAEVLRRLSELEALTTRHVTWQS